MWRKILIVCLCLVFLSSCASAPLSESNDRNISSDHVDTKPIELFQEPFEMISSTDMTSYGSGNSTGYYSAFLNEDGSRNIIYTDYETASQVYLCAQPNCEHNNESCTSWIEPFNGSVVIAVNDNIMVLIYSSYSERSKIVKADLNGENRMVVFQLPNGGRLENAVAANKDVLVVSVEEVVENDDNLNQNSYLVAIDLKSGKPQKIFNLEDYTSQYAVQSASMTFCGVTATGFVVQTNVQMEYEISSDYDQTFKNMDEAFLQTVYEIPFSSLDPVEMLVFSGGECKGKAYKDGFFYIELEDDHRLSLKRLVSAGTEPIILCEDLRTLMGNRNVDEVVVNDAVIRGTLNEYLLMNILTDSYISETGNIELVYDGIAVNVNTGKLIPLLLKNHYNATTVPDQILDSHGPKLLVFADISQTINWQENTLSFQRKMALISEQDYLNGHANYQMINSVRDFG